MGNLRQHPPKPRTLGVAMKPKTSTLRMLHKHLSKADEWIAKVPNEINDAFFDNPFIDGYYKSLFELIKVHFGEEYWYSVDWFLTEWHEGLSAISPCGKEIKINSIDDYCEYLIKHEGWEQ